MAKIIINPVPNDKKLPKFGNKIKYRINIETDETIKKIIGSGLLLTKDLNELLSQLLNYSIEIEKNIEFLENEFYPEVKFQTIEESVFSELLKRGFINMKKENPDKAKSLINEVVRKYEGEKRAAKRKEMISEIENNSNIIEENLSNFEDSHGVDLGNFSFVKLYICKFCSQVIQKFKFAKSTCGCGKQLEFKDTYMKIITCINKNLKIFIKNNLWLEYGIEKLFQECGYNTQCGVNLLGSSGTIQEIDVIIEKRENKAIIECKAGNIEFNDVLIFYSKMMDLGVLKGFIFTTRLLRDISPVIKKFSISKNIDIIPSVLEITNDDLKRIVINREIK